MEALPIDAAALAVGGVSGGTTRTDGIGHRLDALELHERLRLLEEGAA